MDQKTHLVDGPDRRYHLAYTTFGPDAGCGPDAGSGPSVGSRPSVGSGPNTGRTIICVHGLTRNGRDFDALAGALADNAFVICPDVIGRGRSDWLDDPTAYAVPTYAAHMLQLIQHLGVSEVDWIGTSIGGLIGMAVAAMEGSPIRRLVLNDVGPFIPSTALERIGSYLGLELVFDDRDALEAHLRQIHAPFGPLSDGQWAHLAEHSARQREDGKIVLGYDPKIAVPFMDTPAEDVDLWPFWEGIRCPTMVLRGALSDLLLEETAMRMTETGPKAELFTVDGVGHAPALMAADQIDAIKHWLFKS